MAKLNDKQLRFVEEYLIDRNATQAAIRAKYSPRTAKSQGQRLLTHVDIKRALNERIKACTERTEVDHDYVIKTIVDTIERCKQAQVMTGPNGEPMTRETDEGELQVVSKFDAQAVLKGAELLGKHLKMFTDKVELTGKDGGAIKSEAITAELDPVEASRLYREFLNPPAK